MITSNEIDGQEQGLTCYSVFCRLDTEQDPRWFDGFHLWANDSSEVLSYLKECLSDDQYDLAAFY